MQSGYVSTCNESTGTKVAPWKTLLGYYRQCLEREQMHRLQISLQRGYILLASIQDQLLTPIESSALLTDPQDVTRVQQFLARGVRSTENSLYYAFPAMREGRSVIPICYTAVTLEASFATGTVLIRREGELLFNHRFLLERADLTEYEIATIAGSFGSSGSPSAILRPLLGAEELMAEGILFVAEPDVISRGLVRELGWIQSQPFIRAPLKTYLDSEPPAPIQSATRPITVVQSNPAQDRVLRRRNSPLQVVSGPPGTGKTQTIINLIASAVCDGQTVLFVSKNNTAVDNVYDAFRDQDLFPGILRLGSQETRAGSLASLRQVIGSPTRGVPMASDQQDFEARGAVLAREIGLLEEEQREVTHLQSTVAEMFLLLQRTEEGLRESGLYRHALGLAEQIRVADAAQFQPQQMIGLRLLAARTANWQEPSDSWWPRLLHGLGLLERVRLKEIKQRIRRLNLPACCQIHGGSLWKQVDGLLRMAAIFPFLLATARHSTATADLARHRSLAAIRNALAAQYRAKVEHDRRRLSRRWAELARGAQPHVARLAQLIPLFERICSGTADRETRGQWWRRYGELQSIFPVICSTNLSLAGTAPNEPERFDLVILDEASQSDIASFLPALYRARRACVVGDAQQLSHISGLDASEDEKLMNHAHLPHKAGYSYHTDSAFDRSMAVAGRTCHTMLDRHYRCVPEIITFCNQRFYHGRLLLEREGAPAKELTGGLPARGFLLDDVPDGQTEYRVDRARKSARNRAEAERVIELIRAYIAAGLTDIGVVTPFRAQQQLLDQLRRQAAASEPNADRATAMLAVSIGTIHTFQGSQHQLMLFATTVAPSAREGTIGWFEENRNLINVAVSRAQDLLILVGHRATLVRAGGILQQLVEYTERLSQPEGTLPPLPPGVQPERLGLLPSEADILREWLSPPGAVAEALNGGEQELYREILRRVDSARVMLAPKMRVLDTLDMQRLPDLTRTEQDYAFRAHFDIVLVDLGSFRPIAAVELDGAHHSTDPATQARDRLKNSLCLKAGLPLVRVRWGDWDSLEALRPLVNVGK